MKDLIANISTSELLETVINIAGQASAKILEIYKTEFDVKNKEDRTPLTAADTAAHNLICQKLAELTPDIPILSEESSEITFDIRKTWRQYWLVDPLDGTREFIKRNGEFTVNIALIQEHKSILGVIHVPVKNVCYFAAEGHGTFKREDSHESIHLKVKSTSPGQYVIAGSRSHGTEKQTTFIERLGQNVELIAIGSSLKFCLVAEGLVDIYPRFGLTSEWDTAAAQCIVEQAGGRVTDTSFEPLRYNTKESLLNPDFLVIADENFNWKPYLNNI